MRNIIDRLEEGVIVFLLAAMTVMTFVQVVLRYVFNSGLSWALETTTTLFAWMVLFGISYGVKVGSHIGIDVVIKVLSPRLQKLTALLGITLSIAYAGLLVAGGWSYMEMIRIVGSDLDDLPIPAWIPLIILPLGFLLLGLRLMQAGFAVLTGRRTTLALADEAAEALEQFDHLGHSKTPEGDAR